MKKREGFAIAAVLLAVLGVAACAPTETVVVREYTAEGVLLGGGIGVLVGTVLAE